MKLRGYQIEDARAIMNEFAGLDGQCYDENSRALIKRFVELVEEWVFDGQRARGPMSEIVGMAIVHPDGSKRIFPYGDRP